MKKKCNSPTLATFCLHFLHLFVLMEIWLLLHNITSHKPTPGVAVPQISLTHRQRREGHHCPN